MLESYNEEKQGFINHDVYKRMSKKLYLAMRCAGKIPKAITSICVLLGKPDKDDKLHRTKSQSHHCSWQLWKKFEDLVY